MFVLVKVLWPLLLIGLWVLYFCCLYILGLFCWFVLFGLLTDLCCVVCCVGGLGGYLLLITLL